ncbi:excisionase family DNA binding domain-containing protein [Bacteroides thetaiotaomicron dnLKV9]|uniref:Excisionase family DNA binding domain-containing protein n=1 Tax=Bacteroides thetaiotaomicron dnLKV9 TaxID=1235785 RepID=R9HE94_BACT4|nr:helix-turn-helix domain-containing protein [Bacteroides thetaiotaomicron]EOS02101.1 excisionase family DNA binding domain-containing protein [Bacteroides thetaiotaomicron dnLKV9]
MDILDNKSQQIGTFFTTLDELSNTIQQALQNRTPHLNGEKYLTNQEVCQLLRISSRTLQSWRDTGQIPFIKLKGKILYRESEVINYLKIDLE